MNNLSNMKKDQPFKVPEDYFENLGDRIQERIETEENPKGRNIFVVLKPYMWMAASIIGVVLAVRVVITTFVPSDYKNQQITQETTSIDTQNSILNTDVEDSEWFFDDISDDTSDAIIEYLSDYDIETETLLANL